MKKDILLSPPDMSGEELNYVHSAFEDNWIAPVGPHVDAFEQEIKEYVGAEHGIAVSSGTAGIHLALIAAGVKEGDVVLCQDFTFAASVNPILYQGATPVLIDSDKETWNLSAKLLKEALKKEKKVKALIVTHIYGQLADMSNIKKLCAAKKIILIEDACESLGSIYHGKHAGTIGDIGIYSFNGNKIITTSGGGMVVTNNKEYAEKIKYFACQAKSSKPYYLHKELGYNYRLSNVLAGIGRAQLLTLDNKIAKRKKIYDMYASRLADSNRIEMMPQDRPDVSSNRWLSVILLADNNPLELKDYLAGNKIESRLVWNPMHKQPFLRDYRFYKEADVSFSSELFSSGLCLPSGSNLSITDQERVINEVKKFLAMRGV